MPAGIDLSSATVYEASNWPRRSEGSVTYPPQCKETAGRVRLTCGANGGLGRFPFRKGFTQEFPYLGRAGSGPRAGLFLRYVGGGTARGASYKSGLAGPGLLPPAAASRSRCDEGKAPPPKAGPPRTDGSWRTCPAAQAGAPQEPLTAALSRGTPAGSADPCAVDQFCRRAQDANAQAVASPARKAASNLSGQTGHRCCHLSNPKAPEESKSWRHAPAGMRWSRHRGRRRQPPREPLCDMLINMAECRTTKLHQGNASDIEERAEFGGAGINSKRRAAHLADAARRLRPSLEGRPTDKIPRRHTLSSLLMPLGSAPRNPENKRQVRG